MIAEKIRNRVITLLNLSEAGRLTKGKLKLAMEGFLGDADLIEQIEGQPVPMARQHAGDEGVLDFVNIKARREAEGWLRSQGLKVPPRGPRGPGDAA